MRHWTLGIVLFVTGIALGETPEHIRNQLTAAANATGTFYVAARNGLVILGSNAVPGLEGIASDKNEVWQLRLLAGIVKERIQRSSEIAALSQKKWSDDPGYRHDWDQNRAGPVLGLCPLVTLRYRQMGLYWFYAEQVWKETADHPSTPRMDESAWRIAARDACIDSPVYPLLMKVLQERIRNDIGFKKFERWGEFEYLVNIKTNTPLPFLLEIIPSIPVNDPRQRDDYMFKTVTGMARPEDVPLIEKHFKDKGQDVPVMLREPLRKLKERQKPNAAAP